MISDERGERDAAYAEAHIRLQHPSRGWLLVEPRRDGHVVGRFPDAEGRTIYIVTAHNPGRLLPEAVNESRHEQLIAHLAARADLTVWAAEGGDPEWRHREESVAIVGLSEDEARELGRAFEQESVFVWRPDALLVMDCDSGRVITSGWSITPDTGI